MLRGSNEPLNISIIAQKNFRVKKNLTVTKNFSLMHKNRLQCFAFLSIEIVQNLCYTKDEEKKGRTDQ